MKKKLISGVKPTGRPHIGNYFGAMRQFVEMQDQFDPTIFIADLHALTTVQNREEMSQNILELATDYLAIGLDPKKVTLFKQSDTPEVATLGWIFNCITTMPYLMRAHAYKDAEAKNKEINVGLFDYPLLMAADILVHDIEIVPVGEDQRQHVEYARDTAEKFNRIFGETFILPKAHILESVKTIPGTDGKKMSKSYGNTIQLFATLDEIKKAVMSIPTDSIAVKDPKPEYKKDTVYLLHELFSTGDELEKITNGYKNGGLSYKESKDTLIKNIDAFISPMRDRRAELAKDKDYVRGVLSDGAKVARKAVIKKTEEVYKKVGF